MSDLEKNDEKNKPAGTELELKIRRVRTRVAAHVKTGSTVSGPSMCPGRTDPSENGFRCPTYNNICL